MTQRQKDGLGKRKEQLEGIMESIKKSATQFKDRLELIQGYIADEQEKEETKQCNMEDIGREDDVYDSVCEAIESLESAADSIQEAIDSLEEIL